MKYKVHIDGFDLLPYLTGEVEKSRRCGIIYFSIICDGRGIRAETWKVVFQEQRCQGTLQIWFEPFTLLRAPKSFILRTDPYERADITSNTYWDWVIDRIYLVVYGRRSRRSSWKPSRSSRCDRNRRRSPSTMRSKSLTSPSPRGAAERGGTRYLVR